MSSFAGLSTLRPSNGATRPTGGLTAVSPGDLGSLPRSDWDALVQDGNVPLKHAFLRSWEKSELPGLRARPLVVRIPGSDRLVGACPGFFYDLDLTTVRWPRTASVMQVLRRWWPRLLISRTYEVGTPMPLANPFLIDERADAPTVVRALIEGAVAEAAAGGASFVLAQNFTSKRGPMAEALGECGLAPVPIPHTSVVDVSYGSFDEYLSSMRSPYRRRASKAFARTSHLSIEHVHDFAGLAPELTRLWLAIYRRATEVRREVLTDGFYRGVAELDEASVLLARRPDGSIAAFALLLSDGPTLSFSQCGFEEEAGRGEGAYFRLLYEIVRLGIEKRYRFVDLGITTTAPKLDVGAVPVPLYAWIRHRNPVVQRVILQLARGPLQSAGPLEPRHVFKEAPAGAAEMAARLNAA